MSLRDTVRRSMNTTVTWERMEGANTRNEPTYAGPENIPARVERRSFDAEGGSRSNTVFVVGSEHDVDIGDKLDGEIIETVDDSEFMNVAGEVLARVAYSEPYSGRG